jgi:1-acyl-sn-glycerol-3-phosphate acyltransferase
MVIGGVYYCMFRVATEDIAGVKMMFTGDRTPSDENVLLIVNHVNLFDFAYMFGIAEAKNMACFSKCFAKDEIRRYGPWGWCMSILDFVWVKRNWTDDKERVKYAFKNLWEFPDLPIFVFSFLEGRRWTPKRHKEAMEFASQKNLPPLKNTLYPRVKGFTSTILELNPLLDSVYDVTIGYPKGDQPTVYSYLSGTYCGGKVHFHIRRFPISTFSEMDEAELSQWVYKTWEEKDKLLEYFYKHDKFPGDEIHEDFGFVKLIQNVKSCLSRSRPFSAHKKEK